MARSYSPTDPTATPTAIERARAQRDANRADLARIAELVRTGQLQSAAADLARSCCARHASGGDPEATCSDDPAPAQPLGGRLSDDLLTACERVTLAGERLTGRWFADDCLTRGCRMGRDAGAVCPPGECDRARLVLFHAARERR